MDNLIRRAFPVLIYKEKDISSDISPYLVSVETTDNLGGEFDSIKISLINQNDIFLNPEWSPDKKEILEFSIKTLNWEKENEGYTQSKAGIYYIDEKSFDKKKATWKGISCPLQAKNVKNSKTWESISLKRLGEEISNKYRLEYQYLLDGELSLTNLIQEAETDFSFLKRIAEDEGVALKVTYKKLVLFEESKLEQEKSIYTIDLKKVIDYKVNDKSNDIYDAVEVKKFDIISFADKTVTISKAELEGKQAGEITKVLKLKVRDNIKDLNKYALKKLQQANKKEKALTITIVGDKSIYAGTVFNLINAGAYNGKYMMKAVKQYIPGFKTEIEAYYIGGSDDNNS